VPLCEDVGERYLSLVRSGILRTRASIDIDRAAAAHALQPVEEKLENDVRQKLPDQAEILGLSCPG
jgi:hypothetical protein